MAKLTMFRFRPSDLVLLVFVMAVVRAFFWGVNCETFAWLLTILFSVALLAVHSLFREDQVSVEEGDERWRGWMLLVFATPLIAVFLARVGFPDQNYDVLNYHLAHMERGLRGWPFIQGDFFPATIQFNPTADIASGICKYLFGFRLGHLINLGATLWTMSVVERFLRGSMRLRYLRYLGALLVVSTELILFLQTIYLVDLLALPLLVEAAVLTVNFKSLRNKRYSLLQIGAFLGISLAFKLSNVAFALPIGALALYQAYLSRKELNLTAGISGMIAAAIAPAAPFLIFMAGETGNPVFPFYNGVFRSPYWTSENLVDPVHGPKTFLQVLIWPFWVYLYPERGSEFLGGDNQYTGRIALGFVFAIASLIAPRLNPRARLLGLLTASGIVLWSASSGNLRYALPAEVLAGMLILAVLGSFVGSPRASMSKAEQRNVKLLAWCFSVLFSMQVLTSYKEALTLSSVTYADKVQPTIFQNFEGFINDSVWLFNDRYLTEFLSEDQKRTIEHVDVWVNSFPTTVGIMASLKAEIPIMSVTSFQASPGAFDLLKNAVAFLRFEAAKRMATGKRLYTIVPESHLNEALANLRKAGLQPVRAEKWQLPYFSQNTFENVQAIELEPLAPQ